MGITRSLALAGLAGAALLSFTTPATAIGASATCPTGTEGVVIENNGSRTYVCTTLVREVKRMITLTAELPDLPPLPDKW